MSKDLFEELDAAWEQAKLTKEEEIARFNQQKSDAKWAHLQESIPGLEVFNAGGMVPYQAEGLLKRYPFYFRYRGGWASLRLGTPGETPAYGEKDALYSAGVSYGDEYGGVLSKGEFVKLMRVLVPQLTKGPYCYKFRGRKVTPERTAAGLKFKQEAEEEFYFGWGHSPEEAYAETQAMSSYLLNNGFSEADQKEMLRLQAIEEEPVTRDERVWPTPEPVFEVKPLEWRPNYLKERE